ncbi:MAG: hypothetical protein M3Z03_00330 [Actinomycetota bacterium]|nr:hypothetical protein [Actinomycetota bacterium]
MTETTVPASPKRSVATLLESLGVRARRRGEPRTTIAVAGAGCAIAVVGILLISVDSGFGTGGFNRWPGLVLSALVVFGGLLAMRTVPRGPVATAGCVAVLLGIPTVVVFLTLSTNRFPPFSATSVLFLTTASWLAAYLVGPARGRTVLLGAALVGAWLTLIQVTEGPLDFFPMGLLLFGFNDSSDYDGGMEGLSFVGGMSVPDLFVIGVLSLAIGVAYALATRWLDSRDYRGAGTAFAVATIPAVQLGVAALADDLGAGLTGLLYTVAGVALAHQGATLGRRATSWIGGFMVLNGIAVIVIEAADSAATAGLLLMLVGLCTVWAAHLAHTHFGEPADTQLSRGVRPYRKPRAPITVTPEP